MYISLKKFSLKKIFAIMFMFIFCDISNAEVIVNINKGVMKAISVAVNIFEPTNSSLKFKIDKVISNDLKSTYLFRMISEKAFMQDLKGKDSKPQFHLWKTINAQYLVNMEVKEEMGEVKVEFSLYDVFSETKVGIFSASGKSSDWRKIAHLAANSIYERITGEKGYFDTKFLYVSVNKNSRIGKTYRLAIMDQDGFNHRFLTYGNSIVLTPRLSPNGTEFAYFTYKEKIINGRRVPTSASIYRYNLNTGSTQLISHFKGMSYAPRYSPDGSKLIFSLSERGASSIYTFDLQTRRIDRLTKGRCIDTSPCYSPDGKQIVFNSDRGGAQQLYIMDTDGSNIRRLSFSRGRYATPVWSPRGDWIAFTKFGAGGFYIGVIRPDGSGERMLASGNLVEGPTWSPNGRVVMFSHQDYNKKNKIFSVDITGYNKHEINTPFEAIDPEWSVNAKK